MAAGGAGETISGIVPSPASGLGKREAFVTISSGNDY